MNQEVSHTGRVLEVTPEVVRVEIVSASACSACHAAGLCSMTGAVKKVVDVPAAPNRGCVPGEEVEVALTASMGLKAVTAAYVIPLMILLICCVSLSYAGMHEVWAGLAGIAGTALYYMALYFMRGRFAKEYAFTIKRKNNLNS